jgi:hypothetical protein
MIFVVSIIAFTLLFGTSLPLSTGLLIREFCRLHLLTRNRPANGITFFDRRAGFFRVA